MSVIREVYGDLTDTNINEVITNDDVYIENGKVYYKLTTILKNLHIRRFDYNTSIGQDDDFITHDGVDFVSQNMVKLLENKKRESENISQKGIDNTGDLWYNTRGVNGSIILTSV